MSLYTVFENIKEEYLIMLISSSGLICNVHESDGFSSGTVQCSFRGTDINNFSVFILKLYASNKHHMIIIISRS